MQDDRGPDDSPSASTIHDRPLLGTQDAIRWVKYATIGAVAGGLIAYFWKRRSEEPPIRVRDGSTIFELPPDSAVVWEPAGHSRKVWRLSSGTRKRLDYDVEIVSKRHGKQQTARFVSHPVRVHYGQNLWVELAITSNRTILTSRNDLEPSHGNKVLTLENSILSVQIGDETGYFAGDAELVHIDIRA